MFFSLLKEFKIWETNAGGDVIIHKVPANTVEKMECVAQEKMVLWIEAMAAMVQLEV